MITKLQSILQEVHAPQSAKDFIFMRWWVEKFVYSSWLLLLRKLGFSRIKSSVCAKGRAHSKISEALSLDRLFTPSYWCSRIGGIVRVNCTTLDHCTTHHSCCIALFRKNTKILRWEGEERGKYFLKNNVVRHMSIKIWCEFETACFGAEAPN